MIAFASSLDQAGIFTTDALDAAILLKEMSGYDEKDSTSSSVEVPDYHSYCLSETNHNYTVGIPEEFVKDLNDDVKSFYDSVKVLEKLDVRLRLLILNIQVWVSQLIKSLHRRMLFKFI